MKLYRFRIVPESAWRTPWQSDTLAGSICWACVRVQGEEVLQREIIRPALAGKPPFVLSDAFPGDWLPIPLGVKLMAWSPEDRKTVKRAHWLSLDTFQRVQRGESLTRSDLILKSGIHEYTQLRNSISRSGSTTAEGSGLFPTEESVLDRDAQGKPLRNLTVYARIQDDFVERFRQLLHELAGWGFGSDRSAGKGQFSLESEPEIVETLDLPAPKAGCVVLSTFQPSATDPTDGAWTSFTKYGKLGPDFGVENVFKRPLILLRPGACFNRPTNRGWLGRAIPMGELLPADVVVDFEKRGTNIIHWAFGLSIPLSSPSRENV